MQYINYPSITQFQQHVELKDFRKPTKKEYVRYVRKLAEHFQCDPATLTEDQLRQYFLFLRQHKHYKAATMKGAKYSLLCFFVEHLKHKDQSFLTRKTSAPAKANDQKGKSKHHPFFTGLVQPLIAFRLRAI